MTDLMPNSDYGNWLAELKQRIQSAQQRASLSVNRELILLYWQIGRDILERQDLQGWGAKVIDRLAHDLTTAFPDMKGFSRRNLLYMRSFAERWPDAEFVQQAVAQIPWGHNILIITKSSSVAEASFYIEQTQEQGWSRDVLALQIKSNLFARTGKAVTNFSRTLPLPQSDLAQQTLKDPYTFDFMAMTAPFNELDVERQLTQHITQFLLELGKGFAFIGRQYHLEVAGNDYYIDLLFYHVTLKCYVVVELKNRKFIPEYAGKLNFYLSAVDSLLKRADDQPTIGLLLCRDKNNIEVEFALRDMNKPMGVSEYTLVEALPDNLRGALPTVEEIENDLLHMQAVEGGGDHVPPAKTQ
jgi:predicted nuclease of restriction endonuclease-like (RecB) superfamily